jgi:hypothetical protein
MKGGRGQLHCRARSDGGLDPVVLQRKGIHGGCGAGHQCRQGMPGWHLVGALRANSGMSRIASYHRTGRATAWARSSRTAAESARTRRPRCWSGKPPAGLGATRARYAAMRSAVGFCSGQWDVMVTSRGLPSTGAGLTRGTRCGRTRRGCGTRSLPVSGCRLPAPRGHPAAAAPQTSLSRAPSIALLWRQADTAASLSALAFGS